MTTNHTPAPWLLAENDERFVYALKQGSNRFYAHVQGPHAPLEELKANGRLIAAAPELLEALQRMLKGEDEYLTQHGLRNLARAAIAKATGAQP